MYYFLLSAGCECSSGGDDLISLAMRFCRCTRRRPSSLSLLSVNKSKRETLRASSCT